MPLALAIVLVVCVLWALYLLFFKRKRRYRKVLEIRKARQEEGILGRYFLALALDKQKEMKCLVYDRHRSWPGGYKVWITCLGEPDTLVAVTVNYSLSPKKRIEIWQWNKVQYFSLDRDSFDLATREFEKYLNSLIYA